MKSLILTVSIFASFCAALAGSLESSIVVISPFAPANQLSAAWAAHRRLILEGAPESSRVRIVDGWELTTIADYRIPESENPRVRNRELMPQIKSVFYWFKRSGRSEAKLKGTGALKITGLVEFLREEVDTTTSVLLVGSPLVVFPAERLFSFRNPDGGADEFWIPSDGNIRASVNRTPFGLAGLEDSFGGAQFGILYSGESIFPTPAYKGRVQRFWALWFSTAGGRLTRFGADTSRAFERLFVKSKSPIRAAFDSRLRELKMLNITRDIERGTLTNNVPPGLKLGEVRGKKPFKGVRTEQDVLDRFNGFARDSKGALSIGIMWSSPVDLDLYVITGNEEPLCFHNHQNRNGSYLEDVRRGDGISYETAVLSSGLDGSNEVWVNLFSSPARTPKVIRGTLMVHYEGETLTEEFSLEAGRGDRGKGYPKRGSDVSWVRVGTRTVGDLLR